MKGIVAALLIAVIAAITNPGTDDFKHYIGTRVRAEFQGESGGQGALGQAIGALAGGVAQGVAGLHVARTDLVVCSLYELDAYGMRGKWLGVFGNFIELP